ncbi:aldo/keto reductase [Candidatus Latescibacterota bacterium]
MDNRLNRRTFMCRNLTAAVGLSLCRSYLGSDSVSAQTPDSRTPSEWRNRQSDMTYRRLGRTGYMVSEIIMGGNTIAPDNYKHVEMAVEMGLNYLDTAPAYGNEQSEKGYAHVIKGSSKRSKVFLNSKVSIFDLNRNKVYREIYQSLPDSEKKQIDFAVRDLIERRGVTESTYMDSYARKLSQVESAYLSNVMERKYGVKIDRRKEYYNRIINSAEESLKRLGTDYLDLFMCPHGSSSPEELRIPEIHEALDKLKADGKIRHTGISSHSDPAGNLRAAVDSGKYDAVMIAYNILNHEYSDRIVSDAYEKDVGVIAMKVARPVYPDRGPQAYVPPSRISKLNHVLPGDMKIPLKAYLWALQNPNLSCINSEMINADHTRENLALAGKRVKLVTLEDKSKFNY